MDNKQSELLLLVTTQYFNELNYVCQCLFVSMSTFDREEDFFFFFSKLLFDVHGFHRAACTTDDILFVIPKSLNMGLSPPCTICSHM